MRIVTTGGRTVDDWLLIKETLDRYSSVRTRLLIAQGGAPGADLLVQRWCKENGVACATFKANWNAGLLAGSARNRDMLLTTDPHLVVAFPGGAGTANCVAQARDRGINIRMVER